MLTNLQKNIRLSAHYAAQRVIENWIDGETTFTGSLSHAQRRQKVLDMLVENGFGRFLLEKQDPDYKHSALQLASYSYVQTKCNEYSAWNAFKKFSVLEVQAYLEFLGNYNAGKLFADVEECLEYIQDEFGSEGHVSGPGRPFNNGWHYHLTKSGKRIVGDIHGGLDI